MTRSKGTNIPFPSIHHHGWNTAPPAGHHIVTHPIISQWYSRSMGLLREPYSVRVKRGLRGLQDESPCLTNGGFCSPANSEWQGSRPACGRHTALELRRKPFGALIWPRWGLLVKEKDRVRGGGKGTLSSYSITSQG